MSRACPSCGADVPVDSTFCPECSAYVAWRDEEEGEATAESPRLPGEQAPPHPPPQDATTPMAPVEPDTVDCPGCGTAHPVSRSLCQRCGSSLRAGPTPAAPPPPPPQRPSRRGLWIGLAALALLGVVAVGASGLLGGDTDTDPVTAPTPDTPTSDTPTPDATTPDATTPPATAAPEPSPSTSEPTEPPFPSNTAPDTEEASGAGEVEQVTVSRGAGYDQIAFRVAGPGLGWVVEYVEDPRLQGSGLPVDVEGDTVLRVLLRSVGPLAGGAEFGELRPSDTSAIVEVVEGTWFEGQLGVFVGLDGPERPFRMIPDEEGGALLQVDTTRTG